MSIAGHTFIDGVKGEQCACGRLWIMIEDTTAADVGKPGIAHVGTLNEQEYYQIEAERVRRRKLKAAIWDAVMEIGKSPVG